MNNKTTAKLIESVLILIIGVAVAAALAVAVTSTGKPCTYPSLISVDNEHGTYEYGCGEGYNVKTRYPLMVNRR